ncbi:MAG: hypothetical protein AB9921_04530 [Erysipelotrichaceae bacterium]
MRGGVKAALWLCLMAICFFVGFIIYGILSGDEEGLIIGLITGGMFLGLALLSWIRIRPWK